MSVADPLTRRSLLGASPLSGWTPKGGGAVARVGRDWQAAQGRVPVLRCLFGSDRVPPAVPGGPQNVPARRLWRCLRSRRCSGRGRSRPGGRWRPRTSERVRRIGSWWVGPRLRDGSSPSLARDVGGMEVLKATGRRRAHLLRPRTRGEEVRETSGPPVKDGMLRVHPLKAGAP